MPTTPAAAPGVDIAKMAEDFAHALANGANPHPILMRGSVGFEAWSGLDLPVRVGGSDCSMLELATLFRECGRRDVEFRDLVGAGHARIAALPPTRRFDLFLADVAANRAFAAIAITEPETGSDLHAMTTTATGVDGGYVLNGVKQHISRILECTHLVVLATTTRDAGTPRITAFLVPRDTPGVSVEPMVSMGMYAVSWGKVRFENASVPASARIGGEGQGLSLFLRHFAYWRTMMAAVAVGSGQAAIDQAAQRLRSRDAFGGPIGRFTHLQQALALHVARLRMAWLLVQDVARSGSNRRTPVVGAAMAKAEAVEIALAAAEWAMQTFGAAGYDADIGLEKRYRDLLGLRVADGTTDVLRGQVARAFLGERLYQLSLNRPPGEGIERDQQTHRFW